MIPTLADRLQAELPIEGQPDWMTTGYGSIWVPSSSEQRVYRISARTEDVEDTIDIPVFQSFVGTGPFGGLAAGAGAVWLVTEGRGGAFDALARIDPRMNAVTYTIPLGHVGGGVAVGEGAVCVTAGRRRPSRVDPDALESRSGGRRARQPARVAVGEGGVWVLSGTWPDFTRMATAGSRAWIPTRTRSSPRSRSTTRPDRPR